MLSQTSGVWGLIFIAVGAVVGFTVGQFGPVSLAEACGFSAALLVFLGWCFWHERRRRWFWIYMAAVAVLHAVVIALVQWPQHRQTSKEDGLIGFVDVMLMFGVGYFISHTTNKANGRLAK